MIRAMNDEQRGAYLRTLERDARQRRQWEIERTAWALARHMTLPERVAVSAWLWLRRKIRA